MAKKCSTCKKSGDFSANKSRPDGLHTQCRSCQSDYYQSVKDRRSADVFDKRRKRKEDAVKYLGGSCEDCGYAENIDGFQFDHLPEHGKPDRRALQLLNSWRRIVQELDKCELVCGTCHAIRTATRRHKSLGGTDEGG